MSNENEYSGRRAEESPKDEPTNYVGRRVNADDDEPDLAQQPGSSGGLFYDPFAEYEPDDAELSNEGEAFNVKRGRHEALIEGVYSTEIDGGDMSTFAKKKKLNPVVFAAFGLLAILLLAGGYVFLTKGEPTAPPVTTNETLTGVLPKKYPGLVGKSNYTTVKVEGNAFVASSGSKLSGKGLIPVPGGEDCTLTNNKDFCFAGTFPLSSGGRVFYTNDLVNSENFANLYEYTEAQYRDERKKTVTVANVVTDFIGTPTRFLLYIDSTNADGWFMEIPMEAAPGTEQELINTFTYTP